MNICIAGWYFHKPFLKTIKESGYPWFIVAHRGNRDLNGNSAVIPNRGLEFGCYQWFLQNKWEGGNTFFVHDDNEITSNALKIIEGLPFDQCFLFNSVEELFWNARVHGRAFVCSDRFLRRLKDDGGFWYDEENTGNNGITKAGSPNDHNLGIIRFKRYLGRLPKEFVTGAEVIFGLNCGYRGRISCPISS